MPKLLLGFAAPLAATAIPATPAVALDPAQPQFTTGAAAGVTVHRGGQWRDGRHHGDDDRRRRHRGGAIFIYDRDWQGDSAWRSNSYNDWWHERPHRSYPRWVRHNDDCQRVWQGGGAWRCEW